MEQRDYLNDNRRIDSAIRFAMEHHAGQLRKGTTRPYILHPMEVACVLNAMNADADLIIAGLLHDTLEDTTARREELAEGFGEDTAALVSAHSEDKSKSWQERKEHSINALYRAEHRLKMLVLADKLSNMRSIARDYRTVGEDVWKRFSAPRERQKWYYAGNLDAMKDLKGDIQAGPFYEELEELFREVFG